jgi:hypothetical protein
MQNGDAFHAFTQETLNYLSDKTVLEYHQRPLPSEMDKEMAGIVARFMEGKPEQRETFQKSIPPKQLSLFGIFSHRAATLSVRNGVSDMLLYGLVADAIANYVVPDKRDVMIGLAVHHHCAHKLGLDPAEIFAQAAQYATPHMAELLITFGHRTDIHLRSFGWRELKTPEGVKYKFEFR